MKNPSPKDVEVVIKSYQDPYLKTDLFAANCIKEIVIEGAHVRVLIELGYPAEGLCKGIEQLLSSKIGNVLGVDKVEVKVGWSISTGLIQGKIEAMAEVKNIIAIASGKGGVGKSTTAANIALALVAEGARVGLLDADIYGPSMGKIFGIVDGQRPEIKNEKFFIPIEAYGIQLMSMAFLVTEDTPVVWRGPMVSGALQQLLSQTIWNKLDYLIVDMPPGTGDIQLTLAQKVPVTGSVIVTTPQDLALIDGKKGIEMFRKVDIPVLGIVENMAIHVCSSCGHSEHLFGEGGGSRIAKAYDVELLGSLPLSMMIGKQADSGKPTVAAEPESQITMIYRDIARHLTAELSMRNNSHPSVPKMSMSND
ncbi:MAG: iron-sulfur cluster carrier protein ApbC [Candidatus Endonucleobacter bathymodioli]|uniref:Iron-sulfur cluster carrier protein n=1 Tax=Candidatus Endonucleibacter bathymodioli TaxID=539814 RepID=A0AA90NSL4_9GAMM|nr:iron-sulfur cluster carrier protein ApbC [Candidatus Endonucleobacter bathymodioli]